MFNLTKTIDFPSKSLPFQGLANLFVNLQINSRFYTFDIPSIRFSSLLSNLLT